MNEQANTGDDQRGGPEMEPPKGTPDPDGIRTAEELRLALIRLAGARRKVRTVARETGMAASSISELFAGKRRITKRALAGLVGAYAPEDLPRWMDAWARVGAHVATPAASVPRELPADPPGFVNREAELAQLDRLLEHASQESAPRLLAIVGTAGAGKTALALHWGHQRQEEFPDGSFYVDLRGYELAERRALVVRDNVRDSEQVRLLLPGASPGVTVMTARDGLGPVRDRYGAQRIELDVLPQHTSAHLLRRLLGDEHAADAVAVGTVVSYCAGLPLALRIAACLAADRQGGLTTVATELSDDRSRLDLLDAGDPRAAVRSVLSWSYDSLDDDVARTFRMLGLGPSRAADVFITAALADLPVRTAQRHLTILVRARLLQERRPGRMGMHDLLRDYARDRAHALDPPPERAAAMQRLRRYFLHGASRARHQIEPGYAEPPPAPGSSGEPALPPLDRSALAAAWFAAERRGLLALVSRAERDGDPTWICQVAGAAWRHLLAGGFNADSIQLHAVARRAARRLGRMGWEAAALEHLGIAEQMIGHYDESLHHLEQAAQSSRIAGDLASEARALGSIGTAYARRGENQLAIQWLTQGGRWPGRSRQHPIWARHSFRQRL